MYRKHGQDGLIYFGAATGCDFTPQVSGIHGVGPKAAVKSLLALPAPLSPVAFAACIQTNSATFPQMSNDFRNDVVHCGDSLLTEYITPVVSAFEDAIYYDEDFNIVNLKSRQMLSEATDETRQHAKGIRDPKTRQLLAEDDLSFLNGFDFAGLGSNMAHHNASFVESQKDRKSVV